MRGVRSSTGRVTRSRTSNLVRSVACRSTTGTPFAVNAAKSFSADTPAASKSSTSAETQWRRHVLLQVVRDGDEECAFGGNNWSSPWIVTRYPVCERVVFTSTAVWPTSHVVTLSEWADPEANVWLFRWP